MKGTDNYSQTGVSAAFVMWAGFAALLFAVLSVNAVLWAFGLAALAWWHWFTLTMALLLAGLEAPESRRHGKERAAGYTHPQAATRPRRHCGDDCGDDE